MAGSGHLPEHRNRTVDAVVDELARARSKHPRGFNSAHEGYAVILEELDELWEEARRQSDDRSYARMRAEAVQVAAMAMRFIEDVCDPKLPREVPHGS